MPSRPRSFTYLPPREMRRRKVSRGAAAIRLRARLAKLEKWFGQRPRSAEETRMYELLAKSMREGIAEADRKAARIAKTLSNPKVDWSGPCDPAGGRPKC